VKPTSWQRKIELPSLRELSAFLAVARCGSVARAAEELDYFNSSSVIYHIKSLEKRYNVELFFHRRKRMELTEKGHLMFSLATEILERLEKLEAAITQDTEGASRLIFGGPVLSQSLLLSVYRWLCTERPAMQVRYRNYWDSKDVENALLQEEIDVGILYRHSSRSANRLKLIPMRENVLVVAPPSPVLGDGKTITKGELSKQNLLVPEANADQGLIVRQVVRQLGIRFRSVEHVSSTPIMNQEILAGRGVGLLLERMVRDRPMNLSTQLLRIAECERYADFFLAYLSDKTDSSCAETLLEAVRIALGQPVSSEPVVTT
jgi:LysR family hca operon transcriptional activator